MREIYLLATVLLLSNVLWAQNDHPEECFRKRPKFGSLPVSNNKSAFSSVASSTCGNLDFEDGDFGGWNGYEGNNQNSNAALTVVTGPITPPTNANSSETSCDYFSLVNSGVDPWTGVSLVSPLGGWSARLGGENRNVGSASYPTCPDIASNSVNNTAGEILERTFLVTAANSAFQYCYLFIYADNGTHPNGAQPYFRTEVLDSSGAVINCFSSTQQGLNGVAPPGYAGDVSQGYFYTPSWVTNVLNLLPYVGHNITIRFTVAGCNQTAHFGYAYIDCACRPFTLLPNGCNNSISAPSVNGGTYSWSGPGIVSGANAQTVTINANGTYSVNISYPGGCSVQLDTTITLAAHPTVTLNSPTICAGTSATLTANGATSYSWSTGETTNSIVVSPASSANYTVTGTSTCSSSAIASVTVKNITVTSASICAGFSATLTASGANTYSWNTGATTNTISASPTSDASYTVTGTAAGVSCSSVGTITVFANPSVSASSTSVTCHGGFNGSATAIVSGGTPAYTYTWMPGYGMNSTVTASAGTYSVQVRDIHGCAGTASVSVAEPPAIAISLFSYGVTCIGATNGNITAVVSGGTPGYSYTWSPSGGNAASANNLSPGTYTVTVGDTHGCIKTASDTLDPSAPPAAPAICVVTNDSSSNNNAIYWDKTNYPSADSFIVHRYVDVNQWQRIGAVSKSALSKYVDVNRNIGFLNGDPSTGFYLYKLQMRDTCGNYSALSDAHNSIYLTDNQSGTLYWSFYGVGTTSLTPVSSYNLLRDSLNTGDWHIIATTQPYDTSYVDPTYFTYLGTAHYRVEALGFNCTPTMRYASNSSQSITITKSSSNIAVSATTSLLTNGKKEINIYPNPANQSFKVVLGDEIHYASVILTNLLGEDVRDILLTNQKDTIETNDLQDGAYFVKVLNSGKVQCTKKLIVQH